MTERKLGWKRQPKDHRDHKVKFNRVQLPTMVDLRDQMPPIYDQGSLGSCTGNAIAAAYQFEDMKQGHPSFIPSRIFIYFNERVMEETIDEDAGAIIRDGMKCVKKKGVCPEDMWPYDIDKFKIKPSDDCYAIALDNQVLKYEAVEQTSNEIKGCLAEGYPIVLGITLFKPFLEEEVAKTGIVPIPYVDDKPEGGHAVLCVGYNEDTQMYIMRNSWGPEWGDNGYFYLPFDYLENPNLADDFWTIHLVE